MLKGRLGLEQARIPHADRHGLIYLERGALSVEDGCLRFIAGGSDHLASGDYRIPHQTISTLLLGPGSTVSHDALRLMARHGIICHFCPYLSSASAQPICPCRSMIRLRL